MDDLPLVCIFPNRERKLRSSSEYQDPADLLSQYNDSPLAGAN
jgi:hypothetical protein